MNFFHHKDLGNHLLQLCPKVMKHPVYLHKTLLRHYRDYILLESDFFALRYKPTYHRNTKIILNSKITASSSSSSSSSSLGFISLRPGCTSALGLLCSPKQSIQHRFNNPVPLIMRQRSLTETVLTSLGSTNSFPKTL